MEEGSRATLRLPLWFARARRLDLRRRGSAQGRNRTSDTGIFSPLLYQLSYLGLSNHLQKRTRFCLRPPPPSSTSSTGPQGAS